MTVLNRCDFRYTVLLIKFRTHSRLERAGIVFSKAHHKELLQSHDPRLSRGLSKTYLLRKTARAVVRRARRTLFAPRFRSRSIVAPAHKPATIFSDQSPRDEHERSREVRVRPEGNGAAKKPQHSLRLFLVHHRGLSRGLRNAALWRSLRHLRAAALFEYP